jgi:tetratricopeptide (TPR) repeat protein
MYFIKRHLLFTCLLLVCVLQYKAQPIANSAVAEQTSLQLYYSGSWQKLEKFGEKAISKGFDYFHIRMRTGIACFEQKKHIKAIKHFEKAIYFNSSDTLALEYLYYSYVFAGRGNEARALIASLPGSLKNRIKPPKNKAIESIYAEGGIGLSNLNNIYKTIDLDGQFNIYGETNINKTMRYLHIGTSHELGRKLSLYQGYSNIGIECVRGFKIGNNDTFDTYNLTQHDYYISAIGQLKHFTISPAFHFINVNFERLSAEFNYSTLKFDFVQRDTSIINYVAALSISRSIGIFTCGLNSSYAHLNSYNQLQLGLSLAYFPLANTNVYGSSMVVYLNENNTSRIILGQKIGTKVISRLWAEGGITYGNLQNYNENNAFIVFNTGDKILYKYEIALLSPLSKHLTLSLRYNFFGRENTYYRKNNLDKVESVYVNYKTQAIVGGLKWTL